MTNLITSYQFPDYILKDHYRRTPDGFQRLENYPFIKELVIYEDAVVTSNSITIMRRRPTRLDGTVGRRLSPSQLANLKGPRYTGLMTESSGYRFRKSFDALLFNARPFLTVDPKTCKSRTCRMVSWTLTIPTDDGLLTGKEAWYVFKRFRDALSRQGITFSYVCKLEFTEEGQPHFHFNVTEYLNYARMYSTWESTLQVCGYLHVWRANNRGKDIQGCKFLYLWTDSDCDRYLWTYLKKTTQNSFSAGARVWSCSNDLRLPQARRIQLDHIQSQQLRRACSLGHCQFQQKKVKIVSRSKEPRYTLKHKRYSQSSNLLAPPTLFRPFILNCLHETTVVVFQRWKFTNHEHLLKVLTTINQRIVSDHKRRFRHRLEPPDDRDLIFNLGFRYLPVIYQDDDSNVDNTVHTPGFCTSATPLEKTPQVFFQGNGKDSVKTASVCTVCQSLCQLTLF